MLDHVCSATVILDSTTAFADGNIVLVHSGFFVLGVPGVGVEGSGFGGNIRHIG
tara:strand:+ start:580 stop:741 length:162 start_codon:yes stop_codon:yes gene_type:complete